jgi:hypothetical protein
VAPPLGPPDATRPYLMSTSGKITP